MLGLMALVSLLYTWELTENYRGVQPYSDVEAIEIDKQEDSLGVLYTFTKNGECDLLSFAVVGTSYGIPEYLEYTDRDEIPENFNRESGPQSLNIFVDLPEGFPDAIELRTRHDCSRANPNDPTLEVINKVFARITN